MLYLAPWALIRETLHRLVSFRLIHTLVGKSITYLVYIYQSIYQPIYHLYLPHLFIPRVALEAYVLLHAIPLDPLAAVISSYSLLLALNIVGRCR